MSAAAGTRTGGPRPVGFRVLFAAVAALTWGAVAIEVLLDVDLDFFVWPALRGAVPYQRARRPDQRRWGPRPADLARRLAAAGYGAPRSEVVMAGHEDALPFWERLPAADRVLVHVDAHHDLAGARDGVLPVDPASGREILYCGNFLVAAARAGLFRRMLWVVPDAIWASARRLSEELGGLSADLPEPAGTGLAVRLPTGQPVEVIPLDALPEAEGPVVLRTLALSAEWIDRRLYPRLARSALRHLTSDPAQAAPLLTATLELPTATREVVVRAFGPPGLHRAGPGLRGLQGLGGARR